MAVVGREIEAVAVELVATAVPCPVKAAGPIQAPKAYFKQHLARRTLLLWALVEPEVILALDQ